MASNERNGRKCFTFIWKLENARYCGEKNKECLQSPEFIVDDIENSMWTLALFPRYGESENLIGLYLFRRIDNNETNVVIGHEISLLAENGTILHSISCNKRTFGNENQMGPFCCTKREDVFPSKRISLNLRDAFTVRCKIWKSVGEISENVQCVARTRIGVEKRLFEWNIKNFKSLASKESYAIKSLKNNKKLMTLNLAETRDGKIHFLFTPNNKRIKYSTFQLSSVDSSGNTIESLRDEIWPKANIKDVAHFVRNNVLEKKDIYVRNNVLSLRCKLAMSFGVISEEIEEISSNCTAFENDEPVNCCSHKYSVSKNVLNESFRSLLDQQKEFSGPNDGLINGLQSLVNTGSLCDIKLRTSSQTFPAHMFILSARSPVFKNLFLSEEMKRNTDRYVDITDLDDDTVSRILRYIYSSSVEQLEWNSATKLYVGADKYQILALKDICSAYIKSNLSLTNACEALMLADKQKDENLKGFVRDFILKYAKCIMNSEEWERLMKTNIKLAAETMHLKFKK